MKAISKVVTATALVVLTLAAADVRAGQADQGGRPNTREITRRADDRRDREPIYRQVVRFVIKQLSNDPVGPRP